jgi:hypothetical protein
LKYDYSDAYHQVAHWERATIEAIIIFDQVAYIALRLTFRGLPNCPTWCTFREMFSDFSNEIPLCPNWNPENLHSPDQPGVLAPKLYPIDFSLAPTRPMAIRIPIMVTAQTDFFIEDLIRIFLDSPAAQAGEPHAVILAIQMVSVCNWLNLSVKIYLTVM